MMTLACWQAVGQTGGGIGIYPAGTEAGLGYRSAKDTRWAADVRMARTNVFINPNDGSWVNEASALLRVLRLEKVRLHVGLGARADWSNANGRSHRFGAVVPIGVEAFPFPFQNAGLFFEAAGFVTTDPSWDIHVGIRTVSGFVFYIPKKSRNENQ